MRSLLAVVAILAVAPSADAQTSNCQWIGNIWTCKTAPGIQWESLNNMPNPGEAFLQSYNQARQQKQEREDREVAASVARAQAEINQQRLNLAAEVRGRVGRLLAANDCAGAKSLALSSGDIALANEVRTYCAAP